MALTRDFKQTVVERVNRDPAFAQALLDEAATLFLNGDPEPARLILRDLVNATIGFEQLATMTDTPSRLPAAHYGPRRLIIPQDHSDPAVQFNSSYPPCCGAPDKILFVSLYKRSVSGGREIYPSVAMGLCRLPRRLTWAVLSDTGCLCPPKLQPP